MEGRGIAGAALVVTAAAAFTVVPTLSTWALASTGTSSTAIGGQVGKLEACACTYYGGSVAVSGSTAVVGVPGIDDGAGRAYVFTESSGSWTQTAELVGSDTISADRFGSAVAISGSSIAVGAPNRNIEAGAAYVFSESGGTWSQAAELAGSDTVPGDWFGGSLALDGSSLIVGAPIHGSDAGRAYVFKASQAGTWSMIAELAGSYTGGSYFGYSVALSGTNAAIGAPGLDDNGRAYVFADTTGTWTQSAVLASAVVDENKNFGTSVGISGTTLAVGAWRNSKGAAYVFAQNGSGVWTQTTALHATDASGGDDLGASIAMSGNTIVVGGVLTDGNAGAAYVFTQSTGSWTLTAELSPTTPSPGSFFGNRSLAISGSTIIVGAPGHGGGPGSGTSGSAYIFDESAPATWTQVAELHGAESYSGDEFGASLALSGLTTVAGAPGYGGGAGRAYLLTIDLGVYTPTLPLDASGILGGDEFGDAVGVSGTLAAVGAPNHAGSGSAYVFAETRNVPYSAGTVRCLPGSLTSSPGGACRAWLQTARLGGSDTASGDRFGASVAVAGTTVVVGAPSHAGGGSAYVFSDSTGAWSEVAELRGSDTVNGDAFGASVAVAGTTVVVGAPGRAGGGSAYVFGGSSGQWAEVAQLDGSDVAAGDHFGAAVAASGTNAVVGAPAHDGMGSAYVFSASSGVWAQTAELKGSDTVTGDELGAAVSADGTTATIGAPMHGATGAAYAFSESAGTWSQITSLKGSNTTTGDRFGESVGVSGSVATAGAPLHGTSSAREAGEVYAFSV